MTPGGGFLLTLSLDASVDERRLKLISLWAKLGGSNLQLTVAELMGIITKAKLDVLDTGPDHGSKVLGIGHPDRDSLDVVQLEH